MYGYNRVHITTFSYHNSAQLWYLQHQKEKYPIHGGSPYNEHNISSNKYNTFDLHYCIFNSMCISGVFFILIDLSTLLKIINR